MTDKEAMAMALDALETEVSIDWTNNDEFNASAEKMHEAIAALKEALAEHAMREVQRLGQEIEQEPVCPACKAEVLYECVACSSSNYPPQPEQEPVAWQVEVYINGGWSPMGNPQLNKSRAEALASNPSLPKEKQRIVELYAHPPQRTEQEPVELHCCGHKDASAVRWNPVNGVVQCHNCGQTYTPPQRTWVGLTDEEIRACIASNKYAFEIVRAAEAKLKEKNT
jgi:transcription elongation factor Elf1